MKSLKLFRGGIRMRKSKKTLPPPFPSDLFPHPSLTYKDQVVLVISYVIVFEAVKMLE